MLHSMCSFNLHFIAHCQSPRAKGGFMVLLCLCVVRCVLSKCEGGIDYYYVLCGFGPLCLTREFPHHCNTHQMNSHFPSLLSNPIPSRGFDNQVREEVWSGSQVYLHHYYWLEKKCTLWELWVNYYLGVEGGKKSISDSSEELLQGGKVSITYDFSEGENVQSSTYFGRSLVLITGRLLLVKRSRYLQLWF